MRGAGAGVKCSACSPEELTKEADDIYKPRGSTLPLNEALKSFAEARETNQGAA